MRTTRKIEKPFIRATLKEDIGFLELWLSDHDTKRWFPVSTKTEIEVVSKYWVSFHSFGSAFTATLKGEPIGMAVLYLSPLLKIKHQCEIGIIVSQHYRGEGVGTALMEKLIYEAIKTFHMEWLFLHVFDGNPAIKLYKKFKFKETGRHYNWVRADGECMDKVLMMKKLYE